MNSILKTIALVDHPGLMQLRGDFIILEVGYMYSFQKLITLPAYVGHLQMNVCGHKEMYMYCCHLMSSN